MTRMDLQAVTHHPGPAEFAETFGGAAPVQSVRPGTVLEL